MIEYIATYAPRTTSYMCEFVQHLYCTKIIRKYFRTKVLSKVLSKVLPTYGSTHVYFRTSGSTFVLPYFYNSQRILRALLGLGSNKVQYQGTKVPSYLLCMVIIKNKSLSQARARGIFAFRNHCPLIVNL